MWIQVSAAWFCYKVLNGALFMSISISSHTNKASTLHYCYLFKLITTPTPTSGFLSCMGLVLLISTFTVVSQTHAYPVKQPMWD